MLNPDYKEMLSIFLEEEVEFFLVGAYALAVHGFPRATGDMDLFVLPSKENARKTYNALVKFGAPMKDVSIKDFEAPDTILQIGVSPRRIDIITSIDGVTFAQAKEDSITVEIGGLKIPVLSKEKLIINKSSTGREKDRLDAENLKNS